MTDTHLQHRFMLRKCSQVKQLVSCEAVGHSPKLCAVRPERKPFRDFPNELDLDVPVDAFSLRGVEHKKDVQLCGTGAREGDWERCVACWKQSG